MALEEGSRQPGARLMQDPAGAVFAALADPTRRWIVRELAAQGPLTPTALGARAGISRQAATKHLAALGSAGLAHGRRAGRETRYLLVTAPFADAEAWMQAIGASWNRRLTVLERPLEGAAASPDRAGEQE
jgi:DNA-binding transcriptional ArsR family regulator